MAKSADKVAEILHEGSSSGKSVTLSGVRVTVESINRIPSIAI